MKEGVFIGEFHSCPDGHNQNMRLECFMALHQLRCLAMRLLACRVPLVSIKRSEPNCRIGSIRKLCFALWRFCIRCLSPGDHNIQGHGWFLRTALRRTDHRGQENGGFYFFATQSHWIAHIKIYIPGRSQSGSLNSGCCRACKFAAADTQPKTAHPSAPDR